MSGFRTDRDVGFWDFSRDSMATKDFLDMEDFEFNKKLFRVHIEVCNLTFRWSEVPEFNPEVSPA